MVGALVHTKPLQMQPVTVDLAEVTNIAVTLRWTALTGTDTGGLAVDVDGYKLQRDQGSDTWDDLISLSAADFVYVHSPPLSAGQTYSYRIRAVNEYGSGDSWSTETQVDAAAMHNHTAHHGMRGALARIRNSRAPQQVQWCYRPAHELQIDRSVFSVDLLDHGHHHHEHQREDRGDGGHGRLRQAELDNRHDQVGEVGQSSELLQGVQYPEREESVL